MSKDTDINYIDIYIDNKYYDKVNQKYLLGSTLSLILSEMEYMSEDAMKDSLLKATELVEETLEWKKSASLSKKIGFIRDYLKVKVVNRPILQSLITNIILSSEGLGTLPGFSYGSTGVNPELISMRSMED